MFNRKNFTNSAARNIYSLVLKTHMEPIENLRRSSWHKAILGLVYIKGIDRGGIGQLAGVSPYDRPADFQPELQPIFPKAPASFTSSSSLPLFSFGHL